MKKSNTEPRAMQIMKWLKAPPSEDETTWPAFRDFLTDVQRTDHPKTKEEKVKRRRKDGSEYEAEETVASLPAYAPCKLIIPGERNADNVESISFAVYDIDDTSAAKWAATLKEIEDFEYAYHSTYSHEPVDGGMCYRLAINLDRPVLKEEWALFFGYMAKQLGASTDTKCSDPCRLFYAPYAPITRKDGSPAPEPESGFKDGEPLCVDDILALARKAAPTAAAKVAAPREGVTHADVVKMIKRCRDEQNEHPNTKQGFEGLIAALDLKPFAERGERHNTLLYMSGILSRGFPDKTPEQIIASFRSALDDDEDKIPASDALVKMLEHDLEENRNWRLEQARLAGKEPIEGDQIEQIMKLAGFPNTDKGRAAFVETLLIDREKAGIYLPKAVKNERGEVIAIDRIAYRGGSYAQSAIIKALEPFCALFPVNVYDDDKLLPAHTLVNRYGQHSVKHLLSFEVEHAHYDHATRTLTEPVARRRTFGPLRDKHLISYLERAFEPVYLQALEHALYDWRDLSKPAKVVIFDGETETGKNSILANGLAQPWSDSGCVPFKTLFGFTGRLRESPAVVADETMPFPPGVDVLQEFKSLTRASSHRVEHKGVDAEPARGFLRFVVTVNGAERFLRSLLSKGNSDDIAPVDARVLVLKLRADAPNPSEIIIPLQDQRVNPKQGKNLIDHSRDEHLFARFVEDLEARARVPMTEDLPDLTDMLARLTVNKDEQKVIDVIDDYLLSGSAFKVNSAPAVRVDEVQVWVNIEALCSYSQTRPHLFDGLKAGWVRDALKALGAKEAVQVTIGDKRPRYWPLDRARLGDAALAAPSHPTHDGAEVVDLDEERQRRSNRPALDLTKPYAGKRGQA